MLGAEAAFFAVPRNGEKWRRVILAPYIPLGGRDCANRTWMFFSCVNDEQLLEAFLAPDARLLDAAERRAEEMAAHFVDPDVARLRGVRGAQRRVEIVASRSST